MTALRFRALMLVALPLALAACGGGAVDTGVTTLDDELADGPNAVDPLLAAAVQDPIMSDPQLSTRSNADAVRPPGQPYAAPVPAADVAGGGTTDESDLMATPAAKPGTCRQCALARDAITLGALAARQTDPRTKACAPSLRYAAGWANRLPADLPLHGGARVVEAAGADTSQCRLRAVTFTSAQPAAKMLDWYFTRASRAGYAIEHRADDRAHVLTGSRKDGAAYVAFVRDTAGGGSEIDLLATMRR